MLVAVAAVLALAIGGLVGFRIESGRWRSARHQYTANVDLLQKRLGTAKSLQGIVYLTMAQLHALLRLNTPDSGGQAAALGIGDSNLVVRRSGREVRAYFCDPLSLEPGSQFGWSAWAVKDTGHFVSVRAPSDPLNVAADWNGLDGIAWAKACAVNKSP